MATNGQFYWPSVGSSVAAYGQFGMAANIRNQGRFNQPRIGDRLGLAAYTRTAHPRLGTQRQPALALVQMREQRLKLRGQCRLSFCPNCHAATVEPKTQRTRLFTGES